MNGNVTPNSSPNTKGILVNKIIIAVDFDGTLCENIFPKMGEPNMKLIEALRIMKRAGHTLILWTCREGEDLDDAVAWCKRRDLIFDYVNTDDPDIPWTPGRKIVADIYIDDRAHTPEQFCKYYDMLRSTRVLDLRKIIEKEENKNEV